MYKGLGSEELHKPSIYYSKEKTNNLLICQLFYDIPGRLIIRLLIHTKEQMEFSPQPRWSPDGEWLIYHQWVDKLCSLEKTHIYKVWVSNGHLEKIFTSGKFPVWHPQIKNTKVGFARLEPL